ncbi:MAG: diphthine--ammonia ligase [Cyclobacteriaceae bacterium]|jgi:diphthine-ammonia ligase|nr:diphthine--ammonia ligase [Flammeovirgaceae bacterium]
MMHELKDNLFVCSWSGGKDSCYALMKAKQMGLTPAVLLNVLNEHGEISRSHGIPKAVLQKQAELMALPLHTIPASWELYESTFVENLLMLKEKYQLTHGVFGDIDLEAHREWEEKVCVKAEIEAVLPLWKRDRKELVLEMLQQGIETYIVSCNEKMGYSYLGKQLTEELVLELERLGVDPCGENGEFHTLVVNMPMFTERIRVRFAEPVLHANYWFATPSLNFGIL